MKKYGFKIVFLLTLTTIFLVSPVKAATVENAKDKILADSLVESGSGLYEDEDGIYVYRGSTVNNYIWFNGEYWRIIAIESDGTLKIMKNGSIDSRVFDGSNNRTTGYCLPDSMYGCNAWAEMNYFSNGIYSGEVEKDSSLNEYLNGDYYNGSLSSVAKSLIVEYPI